MYIQLIPKKQISLFFSYKQVFCKNTMHFKLICYVKQTMLRHIFKVWKFLKPLLNSKLQRHK